MIMKLLQLLIVGLLLYIPSWSQPKRAETDIKGIFSSQDNVDFKFTYGYALEPYRYFLSDDTLFYSYSSLNLNHLIPLKLIDFSTYSIEEDNKWMTEQNEKIFNLTLNAIKGKKFPWQLFKGESEFMQDAFGSKTETLLFPTRSIALQAFEYLKNAFEGKTTAAENSNEKLLHKILANKGDVDFEFFHSSLSSVPFKYYYH